MNELVLNDNLVIRPSQAKEIANKIVASVLNPESDKLIAWSNLTQLEKAIELAKKAIKEDVENEIKFSEDPSREGVLFNLSYQPKYMFDGIESYDKLKEKATKAAKLLKTEEERLKTLGKGAVDGYISKITTKFV
jgi:hypothetical protein